MKSFKSFIAEGVVVNAPGGLFMTAIPTNRSNDRIRQRFFELEYIQPLVDDFHCTIIYSKTPAEHLWMPNIVQETRFSAKGIGLEYWPGHNDEGYVVLKLESSGLTGLHNRMEDEGVGKNHQFPTYQPHVTLLHPIQQSERLTSIMDRLNSYIDKFKNKTPPGPAFGPVDLEFYYGGFKLLDVDPESADGT